MVEHMVELTGPLVAQFKPFQEEHIGREWMPAFGTWRVQDGRLCHYFPEQPGDNAKTMIGNSVDIESFKRLAAIKHAIAPGGVGRVRIRIQVALQEYDGLIVSLDESGCEWAPFFGMKPVLSDIASGSRGH
jgi:hypothetical protein